MAIETLANEAEGAISRARIFISYRSDDPDQQLARELFNRLQNAGHAPFMAAESIKLGEGWSERIDRELEACDFFLLLLSPQSAVSEMVTEEVRRAKELRDRREDKPPEVLPVRLQFPMDAELNYDLRGYLNRIQQTSWESVADTPLIWQQVSQAITTGRASDKISIDDKPLVSATPIFEGPNGRPLPLAEPEIPGGKIKLASKFYVERQPFEGRFIQEPVSVRLSSTFTSELLDKNGGETFLPITHCFVGKFKPSHQKKLSHIPKAHLVAEAAHQHLEDYVAWDFNEVEGSSCPLVKGALADLATKDCLSEISGLLKLECMTGSAMGTFHLKLSQLAN